MVWVRENDSFEGVDSSRATDDAYCGIRVEHKLILTCKNDAAISFLHDLENLINERIISGDITAVGVDGSKKHHVALFDNRLTDSIGDLGDENANIYLDVTPLLRFVGTQAHKIAPVVSRLRSGEDVDNDTIRKTES